MRTRELIVALEDIRHEPLNLGWFPNREDLAKVTIKESDRLRRLDLLLPEIIAKLRVLSQGASK